MQHAFFSAVVTRSAAVICVLAAFLTACSAPVKDGAHDAPQSTVRVFKSLGGVQCGTAATTPADLVRELGSAGIDVKRAACGTDGRMVAAVCGGADGRIAILEIDGGSAQKAAGLGFAPLSTLPDAGETPCR